MCFRQRSSAKRRVFVTPIGAVFGPVAFPARTDALAVGAGKDSKRRALAVGPVGATQLVGLVAAVPALVVPVAFEPRPDAAAAGGAGEPFAVLHVLAPCPTRLGALVAPIFAVDVSVALVVCLDAPVVGAPELVLATAPRTMEDCEEGKEKAEDADICCCARHSAAQTISKLPSWSKSGED